MMIKITEMCQSDICFLGLFLCSVQYDHCEVPFVILELFHFSKIEYVSYFVLLDRHNTTYTRNDNMNKYIKAAKINSSDCIVYSLEYTSDSKPVSQIRVPSTILWLRLVSVVVVLSEVCFF